MPALRSFAFNLLMYGWSLAIMLVGLPVLAMPRRAVFVVARLWARGILWLLAATVGLRHRLARPENRVSGPAIYAAKHQSAWDTLVFMTLLDRPAYVVKRELTFVPLFGWYLLRTGMIPVDRAGGAKALRRMAAAARAAVADGRPLVIFPEGTRVAPGARHPYHPGVAAVYGQLGVPVVPVALNSGLFWGRRRFVKRPGVITLEFLPAIPPGLPRRAFMAELERRIESASARLAAAADTGNVT
ncbi:MAG TPA: lysophospholipid acyltransferase family protein [Dongiaceae bacterium]|nr:lysophospholipid acyltransferase family protein [Dongiaceae bacterium]